MSSSSRAGLPDGSTLGTTRFVVERQLGEGSMGAVYEALDRERSMRVALKTLRRVDPSGIYRFKREFRSLADVSHPNLVQFYELFSAGREWFFTMELVEGIDFLSYLLGPGRASYATMHNARRTRQGGGPRARGIEVLFPTPLEDADRLRDVLRQVTEGLMAVHAAGKLHRDLKPDNVLVTQEGRAVVLDFGIAFELHQDSHGTMEAGVMGTPAYMSPEQASGEPITEKTDFYALGAMLYEALTGQVPFDGAYLDVLRQKQREDPRPPSELVSEVPPDLDQLCMRLLARDRNERPDGNEILEALGGARRRMSRPSGPITALDAALYGREAQLAELQRAFAATADGAPNIVFVHAATGMGKSTLVERFLDGVRESAPAVVLSGRCYEHEMVPFKALDSVIDSLSRYLGGISPTDAAEVMPKDVHALAQLFPVLKRADAVRLARRREQGPREPRIVRRLATHALKELLARIAMREPLIVFIDDLQWGDVDSARLLAELVSGSEQPAFLLVCTYRTADKQRSACLSTLFGLLRERATLNVREIALDALSDHERIELARRLLPSASQEQIEAVARESRGSPYLLTQLVDHIHAERARLPPGDRRVLEISLDRALSTQLDALSSSATTVLELVAVAGRPVRDEIVAQLIAAEVDLGGALGELRRVKLVRGIGTGEQRAIAIYDDSIRDAVLGRMAEGLIRNWHRRLAIAIEASPEPDLEALTDHLLGAQDTARAGIYAIRAASQAMQALAFDKAADLYEIAVRHHEDGAWRHELLMQWADALVASGRSTRAAEVYLEAAEGAPNQDAALQLKRKAGVQLLLSGRWQRGVETIAPTMEELGVAFPKSGAEALAATRKLQPKLKERGLEFKPKRRAEISAKTLERVDALWSVVQATFSTNPIVAQSFALQHLLDALEAGERSRVVVGLCACFISFELAVSALAGNKPKTLQAAENLAREGNDPRSEGWIAFARAFSYLNDGLLKPAAIEFGNAQQIFRDRCTNVTPELRACQMLNARVLVKLGQLEDLGVAEGWIRDADDNEDQLTATRLRLTIVTRMLLDDDVERVEAALNVPEHVVSDPLDLSQLLIVLASTSLALYQDDVDGAARALAMQESIRRSPLFGIRLWRGESMNARLRLLLATARHTDRKEKLVAAEHVLSAIDKLELECDVDQARIGRAALAHLRGDREQALRWLDTILQDVDMGGDSRFVRLCAAWRKGELIGGEEGAVLIRQAEQDLRQRGAKDPVRFARMYSPGFD